MTESEIEVAGFREFPLSKIARIKFVVRNWQKCYYKQSGKKRYFVTIEQWDFSSHLPEYPRERAFQASAHLQRSSGEAFNVELLSPDSVQQVEAFFQELFVKMQCQDYEDR